MATIGKHSSVNKPRNKILLQRVADMFLIVGITKLHGLLSLLEIFYMFSLLSR